MVPFDECRKVMHVVRSHFARAGSSMRGVPGDRLDQGTINGAREGEAGTVNEERKWD